MRCPACNKIQFSPIQLAERLPAKHCLNCGGLWITTAAFFNFRENPSPVDTAPISQPPSDSTCVKLCPECARFMRPYEVGHDLHFSIDKCAACGGFWLDHLEWESLAAHNLHTQLNLIASDDWQKQIDRHHAAAAEITRLTHLLGHSDFTELQRITQWLATHAHRPTLLAYIHHHLQTSAHSFNATPTDNEQLRRPLVL